MRELFKKIISGTIILGIILGTSLPSSANAQAVVYTIVGESATDSSITFTVGAYNPNPSTLPSINIEYADNSDYTNSSTISAGLNNTDEQQSKSVTISGLNPTTTYHAKLMNGSGTSPLTFTSYQTSGTSGSGPTQNPGNATSDGTSSFPACELFSAVTWGGCAARVIYWLFFVPTSFLFSLAGQLMDFSMAYTLNSANYGKTADGSSFVEKGWTITRDLSNILFIVMLMWIAINIILGNGKDKGLLVKIVWVGLLINFSLFFARLVIDGSNILAKIFYDNMGVETGGQGGTVYNPWISEGDKSISIAIVSNFNPQKLFSQSGTLDLNTGSGVQGTGDTGAGSFIVITIIMSIINLVGMYIFFVVSFILIGRVIGLWILMIFAPLAFISQLLPSSMSSKLGQFNYGKWWDSLLQQSFLVPVFFFFLYLILLYLNTDFLKGFRTFDNSTTGGILNVIVPLLIIVFLLIEAKKIATDMSGKIGGAMSKAGSAVAGLALGGAGMMYGKAIGGMIGGAGGIGRATIGRSGKMLAESKTVSNLSNSDNFLARGTGNLLKTVGTKTSSASFDLRGIKQIQKATDKYVPLGKTQSGGFTQDVKDQQKKWEDKSKEISKVYSSEKESRAINDTKLALENKRDTEVSPSFLDHNGLPKSGKIRDLVQEQKEKIEKSQKEIKELLDQGLGKNHPKVEAERDKILDAKEEIKHIETGYLSAEKEALKKAEKDLKNLETARLRKYTERVERGVVKENDKFFGSIWKRLKGSAGEGSIYVGMSNEARAKAAENIRKGLEKKEEKDTKEEGKK